MSTMETIYTKPYDANLHQENDSEGKRQVIKLISDISNGKMVYLCENTTEGKDYKDGFYDLKYRYGSRIILFEAERRRQSNMWGEYYVTNKHRYPFKYSTLHVLFRKLKYKADIFIQVNSNDTYACILTKYDIVSCPIENVPCTIDNHTFLDSMIHVPVQKVKFYHKVNNRWRRWKYEQTRTNH